MYEINLQKALSAYLQPGSVVYDVGAHIGVVSIFAGELVGPTGRVFAFEADPENAKRIETHVQRNDLAQIQVFSCAAWSSSGKLSFERASAHSSRNQGSVSKAPAQTGQDTIVVESIRLDDFAQQHVLPPTLIKIDVEGGEADVLLGCEQIFSRSHPVLICEVHHKQAEEDVCRWLSHRGYSLQWLGGSSDFPRHLLAVPMSEPSLRLTRARGVEEKSPT
jgi:FkbM family methyltransferase